MVTGHRNMATMAAMQVPRLYHSTALLLRDGRVVVAGSGDSYGGPNQTTAEFYSPPYLFRGPQPTIASAPSVLSLQRPLRCRPRGRLNRRGCGAVRPAAVTHQFDEDQRYLSLAFQQSGSSLSVDAPASATLAPPWLLYALRAEHRRRPVCRPLGSPAIPHREDSTPPHRQRSRGRR